MLKYIATAPNGQVFTNYTSTVYKFAVLAQNKQTGKWLASWSTKLESAEKTALQNLALCSWISNVVIVEAVAA